MITSTVEVRNAICGDHIATLEITPGQPVAELKRVIAETANIPARYQTLLLESGDAPRELQDEENLPEKLETSIAVNLLATNVEPTDFVRAVRDGVNDLRLLKYMLVGKADVNLTESSEGRPFYVFSRFEDQRSDMVLRRALLDAPALHHAANHGYLEVCSLLLQCDEFTGVNARTFTGGDEIDEQHTVTALHVAVINSHEDVACLILDCSRFEEVNAEIREGFTCRSALAYACLRGLPKVVSKLLRDRRCDGLNKLTDPYDTTLLHLAASQKSLGNAAVCDLIVHDPRFKLRSAKCASSVGVGTADDFALQSGLIEIYTLPADTGSGEPMLDLRGAVAGGGKTWVPGMPPPPKEMPKEPSTLSQGEKNFLKGVKAVREIVKLEEKAKSGANLEAGQRTKLAGKARALSTLAELETLLAPASDLREKNADVLALLEQ